MSERSLRDHLNQLVSMGLIQRRKRYKYDGTPTSDWFRVPVRNNADIGAFPVPETSETKRDWPRWEVPAESAGTFEQQQHGSGSEKGGVPADTAGGTGKFEGGYRQPVAGKRKDLRKEDQNLLRSNGSVGAREAPCREEEIFDDEDQTRNSEPGGNKASQPIHATAPIEREASNTPPRGSSDQGGDSVASPLISAGPRRNVEPPPSPLADQHAIQLCKSLNWGRHGRPTPANEAKLHAPMRYAMSRGHSDTWLLEYANQKIAEATTSPGSYLIGALTHHLPQHNTPPAKRVTRTLRTSYHTMGNSGVGSGDPLRDWRIRDYGTPIAATDVESAWRRTRLQLNDRKRYLDQPVAPPIAGSGFGIHL